jgi:hypothetical protein
MALALAGAFVLSTTPALAIEVKGKTGNFIVDLQASYDQAAEDLISSAVSSGINSTFTTLVTEVNDSVSQYDKQDDLAKGFGEANAYAAHTGTLRSFANYDTFAVGLGFMLGVQAPSLDPSYYNSIGDDLSEEGDVYAGIGTGITFLNVGLNGGIFSKGLENFYFNAKFGTLSLDESFGDSGKGYIETNNIGLGVSYALMRSTSLGLGGLLRWRGLSVGTGFLYNKTSAGFTPEIDKQTQDINQTTTEEITGGGSPETISIDGTMTADPSVQLDISSSTVTIPLEINTSLQVAYAFNLSVGAGIDFVMGQTDITIANVNAVTMTGDVNASGGDMPSDQKVGTVSASGYQVDIDGSTKGIKPGFAKPRLMLGIGFNILPVKIDIPVTYYPSAGAAVGITVGVVW